MATTALDDQLKLAPAVRSVLRSLRGWIRAYIWAEGLAVAVTWLGVAFWASLAIDWFFEPPPVVRGVLLATVVVVLAGLLVQLILRRGFVSLSDSNMAMLLERRFPHLGDSLLTAVALTNMEGGQARFFGAGQGRALTLITGGESAPVPLSPQCSPQMLARTCRQAADRIGQVKIRKVFNPHPLGRGLTASALLSVSVVLFISLFPGAFGTWVRRSLLLSTELWPRKTRLLVEGFPEDPVQKCRLEKVARGDDLELVARADTRKVVPKAVQVRYRVAGGRRDRKPLSRLGRADPAKDRFQEYSYTFHGILAPIRFDVVGGDARVEDLRIEVVESPTVAEATLRCEYPSYTKLAPRTLPVTGMMQIPQGTQLTVRARANKDLVAVAVDSTVGERSPSRTTLELSERAADRRSFRYRLESLDEDTTLLFTLSDTDGITGREPWRLRLAAVADNPPQLAVRLEGIGSAITPRARLPATGQITDDYGIAGVWFEYTVDQQKPATHPVHSPPEHPATLDLTDQALEVRDLELSPGQKLLVGLKAEDLYDLAEGPNVGASERWLLDVVTPEQLRAMLESRELVLKQRFEAIVDEVEETRDLLLGIDFSPRDPHAKAGETARPQKAEAGAEPGDEPPNGTDRRSREGRLARDTLRALTNSTKNAHETEGVADAFEDICLQLINNRIDTEELIRRLEQDIADPLHRIAKEMFPVLLRRVERLQEALDDEQLGPARLELARRQASAILLEMRKVLERMIELEDFNEAVELLRTIIKLQEDLGDQTKQRLHQQIPTLEDEG